MNNKSISKTSEEITDGLVSILERINCKGEIEMNDICCPSQFEIIERAKKDILKSTNIDTSPDEMKVLDNFLFRCWQMGWLEKYRY
jgi:hypothetical protein